VITVACRTVPYKLTLTGVGKIDIPEYYVIYTDHSILTPIRNIKTRNHNDFVSENPSLNLPLSLKKITEHHEPQKISNHTLYINFNKLAERVHDIVTPR